MIILKSFSHCSEMNENFSHAIWNEEEKKSFVNFHFCSWRKHTRIFHFPFWRSSQKTTNSNVVWWATVVDGLVNCACIYAISRLCSVEKYDDELDSLIIKKKRRKLKWTTGEGWTQLFFLLLLLHFSSILRLFSNDKNNAMSINGKENVGEYEENLLTWALMLVIVSLEQQKKTILNFPISSTELPLWRAEKFS